MPTGPRFEHLQDWLDWQERLHPATIELGLERAARVLARTGWRGTVQPVITVGGTNGKGSCVALLDAILCANGHRVGTFTSPHLIDYRERIRLNGQCVSAASLIAAFERIADALGGDSITFFEFNALAALLVFETFAPDVILLEVGLGGRLDAVNLVDPDVAIVASVGLDHMEWLGADAEAIGREKAGIFRQGRPAIAGSPEPPWSLVAHAHEIGATLLVAGRDFEGRARLDGTWDLWSGEIVAWERLPLPALPGIAQLGNAAAALVALDQLRTRLSLTRAGVEHGLRHVRLAGRFQRIDDARGFEWVLDVAHNPAAAAVLAGNLAAEAVAGRTLAVCGMLGDKDVPGVLAALAPRIVQWFAATTEGPRALADTELARRAAQVGVTMTPAGDVAAAMSAAASAARPGDRVVVFGSFHTVGPALARLGVPL